VNRGINTRYHKMLHIHHIFRMQGNVYINITSTIWNCSNNHYTTKIVWENAKCLVVRRLWEPGATTSRAHNKRTAGTKDYLLVPPGDKYNMTELIWVLRSKSIKTNKSTIMQSNWENSEVSAKLFHQSIAAATFKDDVAMPPWSLTSKILKVETTKTIAFEVCLLLRLIRHGVQNHM
jgi:hypothetical protein